MSHDQKSFLNTCYIHDQEGVRDDVFKLFLGRSGNAHFHLWPFQANTSGYATPFEIACFWTAWSSRF
jgi:hypothetical protein